jgi:hypothetical protein
MENKPRIGLMLRGQAWVELHGEFMPAQLRALADEIEKKCKGLERHDNSAGHNNQLGNVSEDN